VTPRELAVLACAAGAVLTFGLATLGLFRLPDCYSRAHATSKGDTLGTLLAVAATALAGGDIVELAVLAVFVFVTTPTATHAVIRAAADEGYEVWTAPGGGEGS